MTRRRTCSSPSTPAETLARFEQHRRAWRQNEALRTLYARWYGRVRDALPSSALGPWIELGSGPGLAREFIPELELTDVVRAPWHDRQVSAEALPFSAESVGALVLFDVLHHLTAPGRFWSAAERVLRPGGRVVLCEPYVSVLSYPVYRWLHEEGLDMTVDPLEDRAPAPKDPFDGNQAGPTLLFGRRRHDLERLFPALRIVRLERLAGPSYPTSGGFGRRPVLPLRAWRLLLAVEDRLPEVAFRFIGFRLLAVVERVGRGAATAVG
jgi:SAM-dependent methyltransferase